MTKFKKEHLLAYYNHVLATEENRLNELYTRRVKQSSHKRTWFDRWLNFDEFDFEQLTWEIAYLKRKKPIYKICIIN